MNVVRLPRGFSEEDFRRYTLGAPEDRRSAWFKSYLTTILQRDVRDISVIDDLQSVPRLLTILAARTGCLLNVADVSRTAGIAQTTLKRYLNLLQTVFLFEELPAWSSNVERRFMKMPKAFLSDSALCAHLLSLTAQRLKDEPHWMGGLIENFVVSELKKQLAWNKERAEMFHWRTHAQEEVDVVLEAGGRIVGVEIKSAVSVSSGDFSGLKALQAHTKGRFFRGVVLYCGEEMVPFGENLAALPISSLWRLGTNGKTESET